jgi:hypothetical protein
MDVGRFTRMIALDCREKVELPNQVCEGRDGGKSMTEDIIEVHLSTLLGNR